MEASEPFKNSLRSEVPKLGHMEEPETPTVSATSVKPIPNDVDAPSKKHTAPAPTQPEQVLIHADILLWLKTDAYAEWQKDKDLERRYT
jgi:hypothetical protein